MILDVESNRLACLQLTQKALDIERKAVLEERRLSLENNPQQLLFEAMMQSVFKSHPYRQSILGLKKDIHAYRLSRLMKWRRSYYTASNITLVLTGPFAPAPVLDKIKRAFGVLKAHPPPSPPPLLKERCQKRERKTLLKKDIQSSEVHLAYRAPPEDSQESLALEVLSLILGGGESGRLCLKLVRSERLLPDISAAFLGLVDHSVFIVSYALPPGVSEEKVKSLVLKEIHNLQPIRKRELEKAWHVLWKEQVDLFKSGPHLASQTAYYEMQYGDYRKMEARLQDLKKLTPEFIHKTAERWLKRSRLSYVKMEPLAA